MNPDKTHSLAMQSLWREKASPPLGHEYPDLMEMLETKKVIRGKSFTSVDPRPGTIERRRHSSLQQSTT